MYQLLNNTVVENLLVRLLFGLALAFPSIVFVSFRSSESIALILIALLKSRNICIGATLCIAGSIYTSNNDYHKHRFIVYKEYKRKSVLYAPCLLGLSFLTACISSAVSFYGVCFLLSYPIQIASNFMILLSSFTLILSFFVWLRLTLQQYRGRQTYSFSIDESACIAYMVPTILYMISGPLWNIANNDYVWNNNRKESSLVFYMVMHFLYTVTVTSKIIFHTRYLAKHLTNITDISHSRSNSSCAGHFDDAIA